MRQVYILFTHKKLRTLLNKIAIGSDASVCSCSKKSCLSLSGATLGMEGWTKGSVLVHQFAKLFSCLCCACAPICKAVLFSFCVCGQTCASICNPQNCAPNISCENCIPNIAKDRGGMHISWKTHSSYPKCKNLGQV